MSVKFASPSVLANEIGEDSEESPNTNILAINLGFVSDVLEPFTGDPVRCSCGSVLSSIDSGIFEDHIETWQCRFCSRETPVHFEINEPRPYGEPLDYVLSSPPSSSSSISFAPLVFVVDTSGSMCVTTQLPDGKYISRLQSVRMAVHQQLEALQRDEPGRPVSLISFSSEVKIFGDGLVDPVVITGDRLRNKEEVWRLVKAIPAPQSVSQSKERLLELLNALEEEGSTALGPALFAAVAITEGHTGSQIVLCTDGLANGGLGALEEVTEGERLESETFYDYVSSLARNQGVSISITTLKGTECSLEILGHLADVTGGDVQMVETAEMAQNFKKNVSNRILATGVEVAVFSSPELIFEDADGKAIDLFRMVVGNVTADTEISIAFRIVSCPPPEIPFQIQVSYTLHSGARRLRVYSVTRAITTDRQKAESQLDVLVIGSHVSRKAARMAQNGKYEEARHYAAENRTLLERNIHTDLQRKQFQMYEQQMAVGDEALYNAFEAERNQSTSSLPKASRRRNARNDQVAERMYRMKGSDANKCMIQ